MLLYFVSVCYHCTPSNLDFIYIFWTVGIEGKTLNRKLQVNLSNIAKSCFLPTYGYIRLCVYFLGFLLWVQTYRLSVRGVIEELSVSLINYQNKDISWRKVYVINLLLPNSSSSTVTLWTTSIILDY